jgi:hypothetical protein
MAVSDTTKLTERLMAAVRKEAKDAPYAALLALDLLIVEAANEVTTLRGARTYDKRRVLEQSAEFCTARAAQCWDVPEPVTDPDEDIL